MYLDIFIVNYFSVDKTVQAIQKLGNDALWSFYVIDNSNDLHEWKQLQAGLAVLSIPDLHVEQAPRNLGFGLACNRLFEKTQSPYVLLLNPDAQIEAPQLKTLIAALEKQPNIAALAPAMYQSQDRQWAIPCMTPQSIGQLILDALIRRHPAIYRMIWRRYYRSEQAIRHAHKLVLQDYLSGAILLLRRAAAQQASPVRGSLFDERYFMFFEDADLSRRLRQQGFQLAICPQAIGFHYYQHHQSKNTLMHTSHVLYEEQYFSWLKKIPRIRSFFHRLPDWINALYSNSTILTSLEELNSHLGKRQLIAWSPSPFIMPAFWRSPEPHENASFSIADWDLLAPGQYFAIACEPIHGRNSLVLTWLRFER